MRRSVPWNNTQFSRFQIRLHHVSLDKHRCAMIGYKMADKIAGPTRIRIARRMGAWIPRGSSLLCERGRRTRLWISRDERNTLMASSSSRYISRQHVTYWSFFFPVVFSFFFLNSAQTLPLRDLDKLTHKASISTDPYLEWWPVTISSSRMRTRTSSGIVSSTCLVNLVSSRCG